MAKQEPVKNCESCKYYKEQHGGYGICCRYPRSASVKKEHYCGEHVNK